MAGYFYERLSYEDNAFLRMETPNLPMHVAGTQIFRAGPLASPDGGIDVASIRRLTESVLHRVPRYRQKLAWIPGSDRAVWVDDEQFRLAYHMRHTALPRPGSEAQLKRLAARILEQPLDRDRPLWETWLIEGLERGRFAVVSKIHHCMIDGMAGVDLSQILQSPRPEREIGPAPRFVPRPRPTPAELRREERARSLGLPRRWAAGALERLRSRSAQQPGLLEGARALAELLSWYGRPPSPTPLDGPVGPHRIFDWLTVPLDDVKALRRAFGCKVNDVVLAAVTGAVREFLLRRGSNPERLDFRVAAPVNVRVAADRGRMGNRVATWVVPLPIAEADPKHQLEAVCRATRESRDSRQALGTDIMLSLLDVLPFEPDPALASRPVNAIVTNVPGPPFPLYLLGAEMLECFPQAPLLANMGLTIGVFSYNGRMCFGFNADLDRVPDLAELVALVQGAFRRLGEAAEPAIEVRRSPSSARRAPTEASPEIGSAALADGGGGGI
jgi:WS/DGAT/MGAT family acyltransferase